MRSTPSERLTRSRGANKPLTEMWIVVVRLNPLNLVRTWPDAGRGEPPRTWKTRRPGARLVGIPISFMATRNGGSCSAIRCIILFESSYVHHPIVL